MESAIRYDTIRCGRKIDRSIDWSRLSFLLKVNVVHFWILYGYLYMYAYLHIYIHYTYTYIYYTLLLMHIIINTYSYVCSLLNVLSKPKNPKKNIIQKHWNSKERNTKKITLKGNPQSKYENKIRIKVYIFWTWMKNFK